MKTRFLYFLVSLFIHVSLRAQPYCTLPIGLKSTCLTYERLPANEISTYDFRFYYQTIVECGQSNTNELHDLFILSKTDKDAGTEQAWQLDSSNKITGVIDPCLGLPSAPCYTVYYYHADVYLGGLGYAPFGFIASTINCCRPGNAQNLTYPPEFMDLENEPPPSRSLPCHQYPNLWYPAVISNAIANFIGIPQLSVINSSPQFDRKDTILYICKDQAFSYHLKAVDPDGDSIAWHFSQPRSLFSCKFACYSHTFFPEVLYASGFSDQAPAGSDVSLDQHTGLLSGKISDTGTYVITISVPEYRNNKVIDSVSRDLFVRVFDCGLLPKPKASIPDTLNSCSDFTVNFPNNSFPIYKNVNFNNTTFLWDFGDGTSSGQVYPSHTYTDTGVFNTRLIVFPGLYCADTAYSKVLMYPFVQSDFTYSDSCNGRLIHFSNGSTSSSGAITSSEWKILEDSTLIFSSSQFNTSYTFQKAPQTYNVLLTVTNDKGCVATDSRFVSISQSPYPLVSHDTLLARGATLQFQLNDGNYNSGGTFAWWPSFGLNDASVSDPVLTSTVDTTYYVSIENRFGCLLEDSIHVKYYTGPDIYVPNAFTPNGDGTNDIFRAVPVGISTMNYFRVYNRYGQMVYQTAHAGQGWDGTIQGQPAPADSYVWEVKGLDYSGKSIFKKGTVVLVR